MPLHEARTPAFGARPGAAPVILRATRVEHDQVAVVGVLDASNGEVEYSWADGCGEPPCDDPAAPGSRCRRGPSAESDAAYHDSRSSK